MVFAHVALDGLRCRERFPDVRPNCLLAAAGSVGGHARAVLCNDEPRRRGARPNRTRASPAGAACGAGEGAPGQPRARTGQLRRPWRADDTPGVAELKLDRLTAWLAAPPTVGIDGAYEQELGDIAQREVPVRVVFINDSFLPVTPDVAPGLTPVRWSVRVLLPGGGVLHEWNVEPAEARALQPAERQDYQVVWDGRDVRGILCPPGENQVAVELQTAGVREARMLPLRVVEKGPIEIVEVDGTTRYIQQQQEMSRWHDTIQKGLDSIERNRFQPWGR